MTNAQTEARMILDGVRKHTAFLNSQEQDAIIDAIATALAAKDAELAKRPDWPTVNATYEKWKVRAKRAEAELARRDMQLEASAKVALDLSAKLDEARKALEQAEQQLDYGQVNAAHQILIRALEAQRG